MSLIENVIQNADERVADLRTKNSKMVMEEVAHAARRLADSVEGVAPAEAMYLCAIASRLEIKAKRLTGL